MRARAGNPSTLREMAVYLPSPVEHVRRRQHSKELRYRIIKLINFYGRVARRSVIEVLESCNDYHEVDQLPAFPRAFNKGFTPASSVIAVMREASSPLAKVKVTAYWFQVGWTWSE